MLQARDAGLVRRGCRWVDMAKGTRCRLSSGGRASVRMRDGSGSSRCWLMEGGRGGLCILPTGAEINSAHWLCLPLVPRQGSTTLRWHKTHPSHGHRPAQKKAEKEQLSHRAPSFLLRHNPRPQPVDHRQPASHPVRPHAAGGPGRWSRSTLKALA